MGYLFGDFEVTHDYRLEDLDLNKYDLIIFPIKNMLMKKFWKSYLVF